LKTGTTNLPARRSDALNRAIGWLGFLARESMATDCPRFARLAAPRDVAIAR
jgi:hypothetical protein